MPDQNSPKTTQSMLGTAAAQTHPDRQTAVQSETTASTPTIEPKPDAAICGANGCTANENLAKVCNVLETPRVLCPSCLDRFLAKHANK
jgi:hypothetical protein